MKTRIVYTGTKLRSQLAIKDETKFEDQYDVVYHVTCPDREVGISLRERVCDHNGKDHKLHMLKHSYEKAHKNVPSDDFRILGNGFPENRFKMKYQKQSLSVEQLQLTPSLNTQDMSVSLKLLD